MPDGVFNLISSRLGLKEFGRLHQVIQSNKQCNAQWERNLRQYALHAEPLSNTFTSIAALRWTLFVRNIDARGWELHLKDPLSEDSKSEERNPSNMSHTRSFMETCKSGDLDIVKAMVERTQVDLEAKVHFVWTPLLRAAWNSHLPVVQYMCEQGADKEVWGNNGRTPLHLAAYEGHLPVVQYLPEQGADKEARTEQYPTQRSGHAGRRRRISYCSLYSICTNFMMMRRNYCKYEINMAMT